MAADIVAIDARRKINSGIGRVSQWLSHNAAGFLGEWTPVHIVSENGAEEYQLEPQSCVKTDIVPFSAAEVYQLPELVAGTRAVLYLNPQTTWSPFHCVRSVNIIHDLWAITNPEWLPTADDLCSRFSIGDIDYFHRLGHWFTDKRASRLLTAGGYREYLVSGSRENPIAKGMWAQYSATVEFSAATVTVSDYIKAKMCDLFPRAEEAVVIPNVPKDFSGDRTATGRHFLTLAKLEERKNLDRLIDTYVLYSDGCQEEKLPLIIAGDPGYQSIATRLISRVDDLRSKGYTIEIRASVSDAELTRLFAEAVCLVFPTYFEGFGLPPLEAMLARVPVIATKTGMMATELGDYACLVDPYDAKAIASEMARIAHRQPEANLLDSARRAVLSFVRNTDSASLWKTAIEKALEP